MQHIYVNFKRFDVPSVLGGVNRQSPITDYSRAILEATIPTLETYSGVDFIHFYPEAQLSAAVEFVGRRTCVRIGSQGVYRRDVEIGGNFGAFTTSLPAAAVAALGCKSTIIGHCEERMDKNELLSFTCKADRKSVNFILNQEVRCAQKRGLEVLYCVGEKAEEVDEWQTVLTEQLEIGLAGCDLGKVIIAYEPVWSIGPGKTPADKPYIEKVASFIKELLGVKVPVIYGGGLKEANAGMLASIDGIDGGLIALTKFSDDFGFYCDGYLRIIDLYLKAKGIAK